MKTMEHNGYCGPVSLINAIRCYGEKVSEYVAARACGTTEDGTTEKMLLNGIKKLGYKAEVFWSPSRVDSIDFLHAALEINKTPVIVAVDDHSHYMTVIGYIGNTYTVVDPAAWKPVLEENGVLSITERELMKRWGGNCKHDDKFTAIAVWKK